jgi:hypothetical protein
MFSLQQPRHIPTLPIPEVSSPLFHDVVGEREEFIWNGEAERLGAIAARPYEEA